MWALVINPVSGQGKGTTVGTYVAGYLNQHKISFTIVTGNSSIALGDHLRTFIDKNPEEYPSFILSNGGWYPPTPKPDKYTEENWPLENGEYTEAHAFYWEEESLSWKIMIFRPENDI